MNFNCYYFNSNLKQRDFGKALEDFRFCILYFFGGISGATSDENYCCSDTCWI